MRTPGIIAFLAVLTVGGVASAEEPRFEAQANFALGGPIGLAFGGVDGGHTSLPVGVNFAARLRLPRWSPIGLEVNTNISGLGFVVLCDVVRAGNWRVHLGDPGLT